MLFYFCVLEHRFHGANMAHLKELLSHRIKNGQSATYAEETACKLDRSETGCLPIFSGFLSLANFVDDATFIKMESLDADRQVKRKMVRNFQLIERINLLDCS